MDHGLDDIDAVYVNSRWNNQFKHMSTLPSYLQAEIDRSKSALQLYDEYKLNHRNEASKSDKTLVPYNPNGKESESLINKVFQGQQEQTVFRRYGKLLSQKPEWHAPWKLKRVINGHTGWVRCVAVEPVENEWFATGSDDSTIKIWDLASGKLKLTLQGHIMTVKDICISKRHPYMFSASSDKLIKCWDLEKNSAIREFHGTLSGVNSVDVHPTLDLIMSAGRDSVIRIWDIRTRLAVMTLVGHKGPINKVRCLPVDPQAVSASTDATVRLWDITAGKAMSVQTHHKRNVRDIAFNPSEFSFASACTDDIRSWSLPEGQLLTNYQSESLGVINTLACNPNGVLFAGSDNGQLSFFDYKTGHKYQTLETKEAPGSLESERGILASSFDRSGLRLITCESDKTIKIWKQIADASPDTHPSLPWNPSLISQRF
ncbi:HEL153Wp [Eremothecium sinecaudum]|uniref:Pre-mRNA-splicing factor PRP46 n=1 Tax=Eremothecium sinecaudum TaxID=45286 RepID=A0A0X8HTH9_9SACH|nr:HEL153Wp [Eremothecium sinecaudum]AMD21128.1 HEL153Wp [Eremothecium sinecaudum]